MAGQGTATLELIEDGGALDLLLVPVGGGGLIAGSATAATALCPGCRVVGVEPEAGDDTARSLAAGERVVVPGRQDDRRRPAARHAGRAHVRGDPRARRRRRDGLRRRDRRTRCGSRSSASSSCSSRAARPALAALLHGKVECARAAHGRDPVGRQRRRSALPRADGALGSAAMRTAILTVSTSVANRDQRRPLRAPCSRAWRRQAGCEIVGMEVVPDDFALIEDRLHHFVDQGCDLVFTTGGTGMTPDDITPEATRGVIHREAPGLAEAMRAEGARHTPLGILTRGDRRHRRGDADRQLPRQPASGRAALPRDRAGARARGADPAGRLQPWQPPPRGIARRRSRWKGSGAPTASGSRCATSRSRWRRARRSRCSAPTAPARRRCCGSSPGCCGRTPARARVLGAELPREAWRARGRIGLLGHEPMLYRDLTVRENLRFHARLHGVGQERDRGAASRRSGWPRAPTTRCARSRAG